MLSLFSSIISAITGGTTNIVLKLISLLGIGIFWKWFKGEEKKEERRQQEAKLDSDINRSNMEAGKNAEDAKKNSEINEEYIKQKRIINEMKLKNRVEIIVPEKIVAGESFTVQIKGIPEGTQILMDNKWKMGSVNNRGYLKMILNSAGKRRITFSVGKYDFEKEIEVK